MAKNSDKVGKKKDKTDPYWILDLQRIIQIPTRAFLETNTVNSDPSSYNRYIKM